MVLERVLGQSGVWLRSIRPKQVRILGEPETRAGRTGHRVWAERGRRSNPAASRFRFRLAPPRNGFMRGKRDGIPGPPVPGDLHRINPRHCGPFADDLDFQACGPPGLRDLETHGSRAPESGTPAPALLPTERLGGPGQDSPTIEPCDEPLLKLHQQVVYLDGFDAGLVLGDRTNREGVALAGIAELAVPVWAFLLKRCRGRAPQRATPPKYQPSACRRYAENRPVAQKKGAASI
jgi:hypothetical protein